MPNMAVGQIIQVRVEWELYGQRDLTVWHYRVNDIAPASEMFGYLRDDVIPLFTNPAGGLFNLLSNLSSDITLTAVVAQVIFPTRYRSVRVAVNEAGGDVSPAGTNNLALSVAFGGDLAGRGRTGRTQIPGVPKKYQLGAKWDNAIVTAASDALEAIRVGTLATTTPAGQLRSILWSTATGSYQDITTIEAKYTCRTMRRRTFGVGQ